MRYRYLEDEATADIAIEAEGKGLKELFENLCFAVVDTIVDSSTVEPREIRYISKKAEDINSLLYELLDEIIYLFDGEKMVFHTVKVVELDTKENFASIVLKGEELNRSKHRLKYNVKAITYFGMEIKKEKDRYIGRITLDL